MTPPPEGGGLRTGEWVRRLSYSPVTPSVSPIFTSQTPRFSPVATATAPARRGHQGNPVPASPPSPSLACPPHPKQQRYGGWEGQWGGGREEPRRPPQKGGGALDLRRASTPTLSLHAQPGAGYAAPARPVHDPPTSPGSGAPPTESRGHTPPHTRFGCPSGPAHCPLLSPPHPRGGLRPLSPN